MRIFTIILFLAIPFGGFSQETFNKRLDFDFLAAVLTSVHPTDSCYYTTGILADTVWPYATASIFAKFGLDGEVQWAKTVKDPAKTYEMWFDALWPYNGNGFVNAGLSVDSTERLLIMQYGPEGDTVATHQYLNPHHPSSSFIQPRGKMVVLPDGGLVSLSWIGTPQPGNSDFYLLKTAPDGEVLWEATYGNVYRDRPSSMLLTGEGNILAGGHRTNINITQDGYFSQMELVLYDQEGQMIWEYLSPDETVLYDVPREMVMLDDGSLIIATGLGTEIERPGTNGLYFDKHVMKLNPDLEIEWEVTFEDVEPNSSSRLTNIIELSDGSGFVIAGMEGEDTPGSGTYDVRGWFAKLKHDGTVSWTRRNIGLNSDNPRHEVYDIDETADGGLIICGESRDGTTGATYPQQAWLLKLDGHGCLVPGCHLFDNTEEETGTGLELAIYPNPTGDYLNFQLRGAGLLERAHFRIVDAQGRVVEEHESGLPSETHIVPVWEWVPGVYFLQYIKEGIVGASERFVVVR